MNTHRSRPIFFPLVLIAIGVLWLLGSFGVFAIDQLSILVRFWPVLLIGLGLDLMLRPRWPWAANLVALGIVALAVAAVLLAPRLGWTAAGGNWLTWVPWMWGSERGSGNVVEETRPVSGVSGVALTFFGDLSVQQGSEESLRIEAEDNVLARLRTEVQGGTLTIGQDTRQTAVRPTRPVRIFLTVRDLSSLSLSGAGQVTVHGLQTDALQVALSGAGSLSLEDLHASELGLALSGAGSLTAAGTAERLRANMSGVGGLNAADLRAEAVEAHISGTGSATVWAVQSLEANVSGVGSVRYWGQPQVVEHVTGLGRVQHLGVK
jgi:hypothetical protein